jgi:three-Cys-motif partner protein
MVKKSHNLPSRSNEKPFAGLKAELYRGRGQTFAKHVLLKFYLTELAYKVLQAPISPTEFLYLDAFSGPWQSQGEAFEDTSFAVALNILTGVRQKLSLKGRFPRMKAIFVEEKAASYNQLCREIARFPEVQVSAFNGKFEDIVQDVVQTLTRDTFLFGFLDPIGWKGIALRRIVPLLRHRPGEVLVNVMTNGLVRHVTNEMVIDSVDEFFGDSDWRTELLQAQIERGSRDAAIISLYLQRWKQAGAFNPENS